MHAAPSCLGKVGGSGGQKEEGHHAESGNGFVCVGTQCHVLDSA